MSAQSQKQSETAGEPVIVIGAGPAGLYAAFQLGLRGLRPVIVDAMDAPGGQCAALYPSGEILDLPGFPAIAARDLVARLHAQLAPFAPLFLHGRRATALWGSLRGGFNLETNTGETIFGAAAIHAGGFGAIRPRRLNAPGAERVGAGDLSYDAAGDRVAGRNVAVIGDGGEAVEAALDAATGAKAVTLIHALPLRAAPEKLAALRAAAEARRVAVMQGEVERLIAPAGRLSGVEIRATAGRAAREVDLLLVRNGLELVESEVTGVGPVVDMATGETETPGVFVIGDAAPADGRPAVIALGFADALRAAEAAHRRIHPAAARRLLHTASSPTLRARLRRA
ncbi:MAG: NAD(P)/FAD-dependent oxidoreductase [Pikeienuella sp.]